MCDDCLKGHDLSHKLQFQSDFLKDNFEVAAKLGVGSLGKVYKVESFLMGKQYAVKVIKNFDGLATNLKD